MPVRISEKRIERAFGIIRHWIESGEVLGAAIEVGAGEQRIGPRAFGRMGRQEAPPVQEDTIFLIASPTKPLTTSAVCLLIERGLVGLDQPVCEIIPEVTDDKKGVRLLHLLTHTSGLPDMLPDNEALRASHQPLSRFVEGIYKVALDFEPGTAVQYQSAGIALLGEVVKRVSGNPIREFLRLEFFEPLGMKDTFLGRRNEDRSRISEVRISEAQAATDWNWNTDYWHRFGAPWGGLFTTVSDYGRFLRMLLNHGTLDGVRIFSPATVELMTRNHIPLLPGLSRSARRNHSWGLGWMMANANHSEYLGSLVSPRAFGHGGATGTGVWADPERDAYMVLFTNQPGIGRQIGLVSNAVAGALVKDPP